MNLLLCHQIKSGCASETAYRHRISPCSYQGCFRPPKKIFTDVMPSEVGCANSILAVVGLFPSSASVALFHISQLLAVCTLMVDGGRRLRVRVGYVRVPQGHTWPPTRDVLNTYWGKVEVLHLSEMAGRQIPPGWTHVWDPVSKADKHAVTPARRWAIAQHNRHSPVGSNSDTRN